MSVFRPAVRFGWAAVAASGGLFVVSAQAQTGVFREVWTNLTGTSVANLTNTAAYAGLPSMEYIGYAIEGPTNWLDNYGQRMRALVTAPASGNYQFAIASDDASALFLSTDTNPANKALIARVDGWTNPRIFTNAAIQQSSNITLVAGQKYYLEVLHKEGGGGDNVCVRWILPSGATNTPIPTAQLKPFGVPAPVIVTQPVSRTVQVGSNVSFQVAFQRPMILDLRWQTNGVNFAGATNATLDLGPALLVYSGRQFRAIGTNIAGAVTSQTAVLSVVADTTRPTIVSALYMGEGIVAVTYSEAMEAASATNRLNYGVNAGGVASARLMPDGRTVILTVTGLVADATITLSVAGVRDQATAPNTIAAGTQASVPQSFVPMPIERIRGGSEPPGPCSRRTPFVLTEIMYDPASRADGRVLEFVEIYNSQEWTEDLGGFRLTGEFDYTFPSGIVIGARSWLVVAPVPDDVRAVYGITNVVGGFSGRLSNGGGTVVLRDTMNAVLLEAEYDDDPPWPAAADGAGHSLVLARPSYGERGPAGWSASELPGGSPGAAEPPATNALRTVLINEWLSHTDEPQVDFIELFNYGTATVSVAGCWLTDDPSTNKFQIPAGTTIAPRGFAVFTQTQMGFALDAGGETILFKAPDGARVVDAVRFGPQANGVSCGRIPDGSPTTGETVSPTPGNANGGLLVRDVVINEILYHPINDDNDDEFIELFNRGASPANLGGWRFRGGISYDFPAGTTIPAGGYLVIAADAARLRSNYVGLTTANCIGDFSGSLADSGERIALEMPEDLITTNQYGLPVTNWVYIVADEVTYADGGRWGTWSDGGGSSLELVDPASDNRRGSNWADSDESQKSGWVTIEQTGVLDNGNTGYAASQLHVSALGAGEYLMDNVEVIPQALGVNVCSNPGFESGTNGWSFHGTHEESAVEAGTGEGGGAALHIRAVGRGDTGANKIRGSLTYTSPSMSTATLRARIRWLAGHPEVLLRYRGGWLEATGPLLTTRAFGTPGAANSRLVAIRGPAITSMSHAPILPAAGAAVEVSALVEDTSGLATVRLNYRVDPGSTVVTVPMERRGAGFFSGTIPGQAAGTLVGFWVEAQDAGTAFPSQRYPEVDFPDREAFVRFGDATPAGNFGVYRLWLSQATIDRWTLREKNSNRPLPATFVCGNSRVIYPAWSWYSGSPFHASGFNGPLGSTIPDYMMQFPSDDRFLGVGEFVLNYAKTENATQRQQLCYWMARMMGLPYLHRRYMQVMMNGNQRGSIFEDVQQPNADTLREFFADDENGWLHKIEDWFEFADDNQTFGIITATLENFTTTGGAKKAARYRWTWRPRAIKGTANDFTNLFSLVDAVNAAQPEPYETRLRQTIDTREWMRVMALERFSGNYDSYGFNRGKNMYAYLPERAPWSLLIWDTDFVYGGPGSVVTNDQLMSSHDPVMSKFKTCATFTRQWWASLQEICDGVADPAVYRPRVELIYNAVSSNGVTGLEATSVMADWIAGRRAYVRSQLALVDAPLSLDGPASFTTNVNYVAIGGTAPIALDGISVNGTVYQPDWVTTNRWTLYLPLASGTNALVVGGVDWRGSPLTNAAVAKTIVSTAEPQPAEGNLVINEIMYNPTNPAAEFVELFNRSATTAYDLSGWRLDGADLTISNGVVIPPGGFAVFAKELSGFVAAYGGAIAVAGEFEGSLDGGGETLSLVRPGPTPSEDAVIAQVTYDDDAPWPVAADGFGPSLQLMDATAVPPRVCCWAASGYTPGATNSVLRAIPALPPLWLNEVQPSNIEGPTDRMGERDPWVEVFNAGTTSVSLAGFHLAPSVTNLTAWRFPTNATLGARQFLVVWLDGEPGESVSNEWHASFRIPAATGSVLLAKAEAAGTNVVDYLNWNALDLGRSWGSYPDGTLPGRRAFYVVTPGAPNDVTPPLLNVRINEWMASNSSVLADPADSDFDDWFELYNPTDLPMDLSGAYLTDDLSTPDKFRIPDGYSVPAHGYLLVWADGETGQNSTNRADLHAGFKLDAEEGEDLGIFTATGALVDGVTFGAQTQDSSDGRYPNGTGTVFRMRIPTPRAANLPPYENTPPSIDPVPAQTVYRGGAFAFTVAAHDTNVPSQQVTLSLLSSPPGASFLPATGAFAWTSPEEGGAETLAAVIRAADDGEPPLCTTQTVSLVVLPWPRLLETPATQGGDRAVPQFAFETLTGYRYQVEYTDSLLEPDWQPFGTNFIAEGGSYEIVDPGATQRFYRVMQSAP